MILLLYFRRIFAEFSQHFETGGEKVRWTVKRYGIERCALGRTDCIEWMSFWSPLAGNANMLECDLLRNG